MTTMRRQVSWLRTAPWVATGLLLSLLGCGGTSTRGHDDTAGGEGLVQPDVPADAGGDTPQAPDADGGAAADGDAVAPGPPCATVDDCAALQGAAGPCREVLCDAKGYCRYDNLPDFATCDDGDPCTADTVCVTGRCALGAPVVCNDDNPCTNDRCVAPNGCENTPIEGPCDDGDACTAGDQCAAGSCTPGAALDCDDQNACTADRCDAGLGCVNTLTEDPCDDGDPCTTDDVCRAGVCLGGTPVVCLDDDPCTDGICGPNGCEFVPNTAYCDDANGCTSGDRCAAGACVPGQNLCPCTVDADCAGQGDGNLCNGRLRCLNGGCSTDPDTAVVCDTTSDGPCTLTACVPETGECAAAPRPDGTPCDDGSVCTTGDACAGGTCTGAPTVTCNDDDTCTSDTCDPTAGCVYTPIAGCTAGCGDGECLGDETCGACPTDCGPCPAVCPNGSCEDGETCATCADDCGPCPPACGDGACETPETCEACPADCGPCPGNGCVTFTGEAGCGGCACEACVCAADPSCCSGTWDMLCALRCDANCGGDCGFGCGDGVCFGDGESCENCPADCGTCPTTGPDPRETPGCYVSGSAGCNDCACEDYVCASEPDCCNEEWEAECTELCFEHGDCGSNAGCVPHEDAGCDGCPCEASVCAARPECCTGERWDHECVDLCAEAGGCGGTATPNCGDAACNGTETCERCPGDCGACTALCGDGTCNGGEACATCPDDCGVCPGGCGDDSCDGAETCATCVADCGACPTDCGNGACETGETCAACPEDCGECVIECGNGQCEAGEDCTNCPGDCGACPPVCGDGTCNGAETATRCHRDCAPDWMQPGSGGGFHGTTFFGDMDACRMCHGQNLDGGVRSCNLCHPTWRTDCTFCHGGLDNQTGAPPEGVDGETQRTQRQVGAHTAHVTASARHGAYDCSVCHAVPAEVFSPGHIDGDGQAEVALDDCNGGTYAPANARCSGVYCHGNGRSTTSGGSALWTGLGLTCNSCHPTSGLSGRHDDHIGEGVACAVCHNRTVNYSGAIIDATLHVNCAKDVSGPFTWNAGTRGCSNIAGCHGSETWGGGAAAAGTGAAWPRLLQGVAGDTRSGGY